MQGLKTVYILFFLAAIIFVSKPFLGFAISNNSGNLKSNHSILVKIFSKRKPENHEDAEERSLAISKLLNNPPQNVALLITALIAILLPVRLLFNNITSRLPFLLLLPTADTCLLTGKLNI